MTKRGMLIDTFREGIEIKELQKEAEEYYQNILSIEDDFGDKKYEFWGKFTLEIISLPSYNADVERLISHKSLIKRKHRNALKLERIKS